MSAGIDFAKDLVFKDLEFSSNTEVLKFLSSKLQEKGYVKEGYQKAILDREEEYPTGLPSADIKIAIPHADHNLVNKATLAIGVLRKPVEFKSMEDPDKSLDVSVIIMLALSEPHGHIEMLQRVVKLIQNPEVLREIVEAPSTDEVINKLEPYLIA
ncbi:PTS sugar transporter subunit IIA [Clostridium sp. YIM B02515]|uniref:PTS sugar transporter subunit IIA n=1 Tax=Clostridium rhizosphaerae TaxID=2803861 RepID=A0ABS1T5P2_9CLOT|nr:PTS sugar transporter subunit IIA [Clostridium rhizosphaerae]MBL4934650.1 PTS sugar transporter subunit IIA [Clostridium rhizosphaerae]